MMCFALGEQQDKSDLKVDKEAKPEDIPVGDGWLRDAELDIMSYPERLKRQMEEAGG